MTTAEKYFRYLNPFALFGTARTKEILDVNPVTDQKRVDAEVVHITVYDFNSIHLESKKLETIEEGFHYRDNSHVSWINIDGLRKHDVNVICEQFGIHQLIAEDILSCGQRPKMDEVENILYCLLNMIFFTLLYRNVYNDHFIIFILDNFLITLY